MLLDIFLALFTIILLGVSTISCDITPRQKQTPPVLFFFLGFSV